MDLRKKVLEAIDFYRCNKDELKPVIKTVREILELIDNEKYDKAELKVNESASAAELRRAREKVLETIEERAILQNGISYLGLIFKLLAQ